MSDSVVTLYDVRSLIFAGNLSNFPVLQSNSAACHPQVIVHPSNFPSDKLEPECVHESSVAQNSPSIFATKTSLPSIDTLIIFPGDMSDILPAMILPIGIFIQLFLIFFRIAITMIRNATMPDKESVLKFCKNTFSWGDYIDQVWDFWLSEGHLLLFEEKFPVGLSHMMCYENQIWIEGIRVNPDFRRKKIASDLILFCESIGKKKNIFNSNMLIDTQNISSISMANSLDYNIFQTWNFYSLVPKKDQNYDVSFGTTLGSEYFLYYVKSWRWIPVDDSVLLDLSKQNNIVESTFHDKKSTAILTESEHFDKTLIVTLFSESHFTTFQILSFLQNYGTEKNYSRIQILTTENLPSFDSLEHKLSFYLLQKSLI